MNQDSLHPFNETPRRTPKQTRPYLNVAHGLGNQTPKGAQSSKSLFNLHLLNNPETVSQVSGGEGVIYGTNVSTIRAGRQLQRFINEFQETANIDGEIMTQRIYQRQLMDLDILQGTTFMVKGSHLFEYSRQLYYQFVYFPAQMISLFDDLLKNLFEKHFIQNLSHQATIQQKRHKKDMIMVGITNLNEITQLRRLKPRQINRLISFKGIVIRCSEVYPQMKRAVFRCEICKAEVQVDLQNAKVKEPTQCHHCKAKETLNIVHNLCQFTDKQYVKFQELPENIPQGQTPNAISLICYDTNVDGMRPGDRVQIIGIYRTQGCKLNKSKRQVKSVFNVYVDLISFKIVEENRYKAALGKVATEFSDFQRDTFLEMASRESIIDDLVASFAPSIFGHENVKKGILTQIFGGSNKDFSASGRGRFRSDINICLVGDPSTAKSQLLQQVNKIAPRGIYTSGRGSSAVGLTANVRKDPQTKQFILQSGALVLSDLGICCIDEFDKMDTNNRTILLEAMQQQTISIAKAGIVCQLNSRTSVLAAANPVNSRYNPKKSVVDNINLQPALLSRFDLIYILLDTVNQVEDRKLALHILSIYSGNKQKQQEKAPPFSRDLLTKYITYAREYCTPILSQQAAKELTRSYTQMRRKGNAKNVITATPRQLQSMIRMSQAFAKMRLSNYVELNDAEIAVRLINDALQHSATDPQTGLIDMDIIATGKSKAKTRRIEQIINRIKEIFAANHAKYSGKTNKFDDLKEQLLRMISKQKELDGFEDHEMAQAMQKLQSEDIIALIGQQKIKKSFRLVKNLAN